MRRRCSVIVLVLALGACSAASGRALSSGISGRVVEGPTCPVQTVPVQPRCAPRPLSASVLIRRIGSSGKGERVRSTSDGRFRARLSPGIYVVQGTEVSSPFPRPPVVLRVRVHARRFTSITITYDTGIR